MVVSDDFISTRILKARRDFQKIWDEFVSFCGNLRDPVESISVKEINEIWNNYTIKKQFNFLVFLPYAVFFEDEYKYYILKDDKTAFEVFLDDELSRSVSHKATREERYLAACRAYSVLVDLIRKDNLSGTSILLHFQFGDDILFAKPDIYFDSLRTHRENKNKLSFSLLSNTYEEAVHEICLYLYVYLSLYFLKKTKDETVDIEIEDLSYYRIDTITRKKNKKFSNDEISKDIFYFAKKEIFDLSDL